MKIVIDGQPDLVSADAGSNLRDILNQLREWLASQNLAMTELILDGEFLNTERREELGGVPVDAFAQLDVATVNPLHLSKLTLLEVKSHLEPLAEALVTITEMIQSGDLKAAWVKLAVTFEVWAIIIEAVRKAAQLTQIDLEAFSIDGEPVQSEVQQLTDLLGSAKAAMESQNIVTVGDLMEYEFSPRVGRWTGLIDALCAEIERRETSDDA